MCKVISIVNQKGGCSKTTSAVNIGIGLANAGKKVVLIDADAQGSLTASLGFQKPDELKVTLATIMAKTINEEEIDLSKVILHHEEGVDLVPGNIELSGLEVQLSNVLSRELILKEFVDSLRDSYDYILIDCAPSLGMMTINALVAADEVIIPVQAAYLPVKGLQQLMKTINMVKRRLNKKLQIDGTEKINQQQMITLLNENMPGRKSIRKVTLSEDRLSKYFPPFYSQDDMEKVLIQLLEIWKQNQTQDDE